MNGKIYRFFISTIQGMEEVAVDELKEVLPKLEQVQIEKGRRYGRVFFLYKRSPAAITELQAPVNIFGILAENKQVSVGRPGLERLCESIEKTDFNAAKHLLKGCGFNGSNETYQLSVSCKGHYRFKRQDLEVRVRRFLEDNCSLQPQHGGEGLHFHLELNGRRALWAIQLVRSRGRQIFSKNGLGGPLIYSIGRLMGGTDSEDVVLARNLSTSGLAQLMQWHPKGKIINIKGRYNTSQRGAGEYLTIRSGKELPILPGLIDLVVGNWDEEEEFQGLFDQWESILQSGGVLALCTFDAKRIIALINTRSWPFALLAQLKLNINGRDFWLLLIEREREDEDIEELLQIELAETEES